MVPVLSYDKKPLAPCKERRARSLMKRGDANPYWMKGIFCIRLMRKESEKDREYPVIALGIDPGSKREGYTVASEQGVVLNITTNTPDWVSDHIKNRSKLRRTRRQRKAPHRKSKNNRSSLKRKNRIAPSIKTRWLAKLNMVKFLLTIIPINIINVEDIKAISKPGQDFWNKTFSPLQIGKNWFFNELLRLNVILIKTKGFDTFTYRTIRGFVKLKQKLNYTWAAHNSDSHCLAEIALKHKQIIPYQGLWQIEFIISYRRQLHVQVPISKGFRRKQGTTVSMGMPRRTVIKYKGKLFHLGGEFQNKLSIHDLLSGVRITKAARKFNIKPLYKNAKRVF